MDLELISESYEPSGADVRGAQILLSSIETSDLISALFTHRQRHPQGQDGGQIGVERHIRHIRVRLKLRSIPNRTLTPHASLETPKLGEIEGRLLDQSYMAYPPYSNLSLIRHVGIGISSSALSNHTVTTSVLIGAVTFFNSLCASHSVS